MAKKNVVVIGGGNTPTVINALKNRDDINLSAVISMSDSGGSSGILRKEFNTLPPGDILRATLAMSSYDYDLLKDIFYRPRFVQEGKLEKNNLGTLFIILAAQYSGSLKESLMALHQALNTKGTAYPVTYEPSDICVELDNGEIVIGEHEMDRPQKRDHRIVRAWLQPTPMINPDAQKAIEQAQYIIFSPGSLYGSIIAALTVEGMTKGALRNSNAIFMSIPGNTYERDGEVGPTTLSEYIQELEQYLPRKVDYIIYNSHQLTEKEQQYYHKKGWQLRHMDTEHISDRTVIGKDFEKNGGGLSAEKLQNILKEIIGDV